MLQKIVANAPRLIQYRKITTQQIKEKVRKECKIKSWQVHSYGEIEELQESTTRIPQLHDPNEVLINVEAASINPIDVYMLGGYGRTILQLPRNFQMELPLTLGRDFCGTVMHKGQAVGDQFNIGDKVYGFVPIHKQGSFCEVVVADKSHICKKPPHLNESESASLVYATMTAWSALYLFGNINQTQAKGSRVLVLGASGGVGTTAVQLLKSQGFTVFGTCSTDAIPLVQSLGTDCVFDYKEPNYLENIESEGFYHIILDCAKFGYENVPKSWQYDTFITLNSPLLVNTDKHGFVAGLIESGLTFLKQNCKPPGDCKKVKWAFFVPSACGFQFIHNLILDRKINPVIHKEFSFTCLPEAFRELKQGHLRGKVAIKY